jgi:hypothetical protein
MSREKEAWLAAKREQQLLDADSQRLSFEEAQPKEATKTVKLDSKKSRFARSSETKQNFEERANAANEKISDRQEQIFDLGKKFVEIMKDKTLPENKGPLQQSIEKEVLGKLIEFAIELNNDDLEQNDGMGSVGLLTLIFRSSLLLRDRYNSIEYKVEQLERQLKSSAPASGHDK